MAAINDSSNCLFVEVATLEIIVHVDGNSVRIIVTGTLPFTFWRWRCGDLKACKCLVDAASTAIWSIVRELELGFGPLAVSISEDLDVNLPAEHLFSNCLGQGSETFVGIVTTPKCAEYDLLLCWNTASTIAVQPKGDSKVAFIVWYGFLAFLLQLKTFPSYSVLITLSCICQIK